MSKKSEEAKGSANVSEFNKFLNNNAELLGDKFQLYYKCPFPMGDLLKAERMANTISFIYDIFSFQKYESDAKLNSTLRNSLTLNVTEFLKTQQEPIYNESVSVKMLKYCIQHSEMFAVRYEKDERPKQPEISPIPQEEEQAEPKEQAENVANVANVANVKNVENVENVAEQKQPVGADERAVAKQDREMEEKSVMPEENEFQVSKGTEKKQNTELFSKHARMLFEFYCKQQQNLASNSTFDLISHNCRRLTLGKFIAFAQACNLVQSRHSPYSQSTIDKKTLILAFHQIAKGNKEIEFDHFLALLQILKEADPGAVSRLGLGEDGYRLTEKLKYFSLPFNTRDPEGRELKLRSFAPKLTGHSGMQEEGLRQKLSMRKQMVKVSVGAGKAVPHRPTSFREGSASFREGPTPFREGTVTKKLKESKEVAKDDLSFLAELIVRQENDEQFLKDYNIPARYTSNKKEDSIFTSRPSRQQQLLPQLRQRVKDLESTERLTSALLDRKFRHSVAK